ncbi:GDSL esterase/lipase [Glycine max]|nr:GDSL esterase/lipase [Glycine max]
MPLLYNIPYGSTYFKHSSRRMSTERLIIDFIECHSYLKNSLFLVEDMGGNELNAIIPYKNITELRQMVPPIKNDYDQFGCLTTYNAFIEYYNEQLKKPIKTLRQKNSHVKITYLNYYGSTKHLFQAPQQYDFSTSKINTFRACCGKDEPYHLNLQITCGSLANPSKYINWNELHFTEATYRLRAKGLVEGPIANPALKSPHMFYTFCN